ncbi:DNA primase family protein [Laspinema olomoucense]|uniref:DNA primase family protein n=1 Tax=Laspinema olomoucense TaxID=3231600 RepID=UPI0021BB466B|nr:DUF5906 domain-containing protein [Laspinema sp. D3d]MCT7971277.1 DUF5906 domain-containing protein [Laspinema sp. D3d]
MTFNILDYVETLTPTKGGGKTRYHCPVCNGNDFTINTKSGAYQCWHGCDVELIRESLSPMSQMNQTISQPQKSIKSRQSKQRNIPIPAGRLELLKQQVSDYPSIQSPPFIPNGVPDNAIGICYDYGEGRSSWRIQWEDSTNPKGYSKTFRQCSIDEDGAPQWTKGDTIWPAYRESEVIAAITSQSPDAIPVLLFLEGEGCVEIARNIGLVATTLSGGAWSNNEILDVISRIKNNNKNIIIAMLPDNDKAGETKSQAISDACASAGCAFVKLSSKNIYSELQEKGDIAEILAALSPEEFIQKLEEEIHNAVAIANQNQSETNQGDKSTNKPPAASEIAKEIAEDYRNRILWNDEHNTWMMYGLVSDGVWSPVSETFVETSINDIVSSRNITNYTPKYIKNIVGILRYLLFSRLWNERSNREILPFSNGILELKSGEFSEHSPGNRLTWALPRPYSVISTDWSIINNWLDEATNNQEAKHLLVCFAAAVLRGRSDLQKFLHLIGVGGTGKSTLTNLLAALIGEQNVVTLSLPDLEDKHAVAQVFGKRLLLLPDQDKVLGRLGNFKRLTGQDPLNARRLYKDGFQFRFSGMAVVTSNFPIFHTDAGSWLTRRVLMAEFLHKPSAAQLRDLETEFSPELPAFTNYLLSIPECVIERTLRGIGNPTLSPVLWESKIRTDSIAAWVSEWIISDVNAKTQIGSDKDEWKDSNYQPAESTLFGSYNLFCRQSGLQPKSINNFSADLIELCSQTLKWECSRTRDSKGRKSISGIRLRTDDDKTPTIDQQLDDSIKSLSSHSVPDFGSNVESDFGFEIRSAVGSDNVGYQDDDTYSTGEQVLMTTTTIAKDNQLSIDEWCQLLIDVANFEQADKELLTDITGPMPEEVKRQVWQNLDTPIRDRLKIISSIPASPILATTDAISVSVSDSNHTQLSNNQSELSQAPVDGCASLSELELRKQTHQLFMDLANQGVEKSDLRAFIEQRYSKLTQATMTYDELVDFSNQLKEHGTNISQIVVTKFAEQFKVGEKVLWNNKAGIIRSLSNSTVFLCLGHQRRNGGKKWETEEIIESVPISQLQKISKPESEIADDVDIELIKQTTKLIKSVIALGFDETKLKNLLVSRYGVNDRRQMNNQQLNDLLKSLTKLESDLKSW